MPLEEPYRKLVIAYFNLIFGSSSQSDLYWVKLTSKVANKFNGFSDPNIEVAPNQKSFILSLIASNSKQFTPQWILISRIIKIMGLKFVKGTETEIQSSSGRLNKVMPFSRRDLDQIGEKIKHMDIVSQAEGYLLLVTGMNCRATDPSAAINCLSSAIEHFEEGNFIYSFNFLIY